MNRVALNEIKDIAAYELERKQWRPLVVALKDRRRVRVGDHLTFLFENRETVRYQIQEMLRIERIVETAAIRHELDTYNEQIPAEGELSATLLIEYESAEERDVRLRELTGLEDHIWMVVADQPPSKIRFDTRQIATDRISAVQYVKIPLTPEQRAGWKRGAKIAADHPNYRAEQALTPEQIAELARDFA
ncbi:MAG: DUF3501 family protein [Bryobacteraceae bacterium]